MKAIELYVRSEKKLKPPRDGSYSDYDAHPCQAKFNLVNELTPAEKGMISALLEVAEKKKLALRVYDMATWKGKLMAAMKGIKAAPTIVVGERRIEGFPSKTSLLEIL